MQDNDPQTDPETTARGDLLSIHSFLLELLERKQGVHAFDDAQLERISGRVLAAAVEMDRSQRRAAGLALALDVIRRTSNTDELIEAGAAPVEARLKEINEQARSALLDTEFDDRQPGEIEPHDDLLRTLGVVRSAYAWTIDVDGRLIGLVSGDMGYESTSIVIPKDHVIAAANTFDGGEPAAIARLSEKDGSVRVDLEIRKPDLFLPEMEHVALYVRSTASTERLEEKSDGPTPEEIDAEIASRYRVDLRGMSDERIVEAIAEAQRAIEEHKPWLEALYAFKRLSPKARDDLTQKR